MVPHRRCITPAPFATGYQCLPLSLCHSCKRSHRANLWQWHFCAANPLQIGSVCFGTRICCHTPHMYAQIPHIYTHQKELHMHPSLPRKPVSGNNAHQITTTDSRVGNMFATVVLTVARIPVLGTQRVPHPANSAGSSFARAATLHPRTGVPVPLCEHMHVRQAQQARSAPIWQRRRARARRRVAARRRGCVRWRSTWRTRRWRRWRRRSPRGCSASRGACAARQGMRTCPAQPRRVLTNTPGRGRLRTGGHCARPRPQWAWLRQARKRCSRKARVSMQQMGRRCEVWCFVSGVGCGIHR